MTNSDDFSQQLIEEMLQFLEEGGDDDAAVVLRTCGFAADEKERFTESPPGLWISLSCSRTVYDMLSQPDHPLWGPIRYAVEALTSGPSEINPYFQRMSLSPETQQRLASISAKYAALPTSPMTVDSASPRAYSSDEIDPTLCFVIMSFSENSRLKEAYSHAVKPTVEQLGYRCERADEQHFNGSIRERIMSNIRRARFIIADMTEARPNCYYELGIAHALGKEVIHIAGDKNDIHFDIKDVNFVVYGTVSELKKRLRERIEATVGTSASG